MGICISLTFNFDGDFVWTAINFDQKKCTREEKENISFVSWAHHTERGKPSNFYKILKRDITEKNFTEKTDQDSAILRSAPTLSSQE